MGADPSRAGRLFLEAIRLDREPFEAARRGARASLTEEGPGPGGFILFGGESSQVRALVEELREVAGRPLWMAADLERGAGQQFAGAATLPPPAALADHPEPVSAVRRAAELTAREARALGINWIFAPVLDLDVEPENPIVGTRSFGSDPATVARLGRVWIEACQGAGVAACAKHFPGHGRTLADSHLALPIVEADRQTLQADLHPFGEVADRVLGMMTAHVSYSAWNGEDPATLDPAILRDLLREELGFGGLVVTDALIMGALGAGAGAAAEGWVAVKALRAGCDLLLYPSDLALAVRTVRQAASRDSRLAGIVESALRRSEEALARYTATLAPAEVEAGAPGATGSASQKRPDGVRLRAFRPKAPELLDLAGRCIRSHGETPGKFLERSRPLWLHAISDDPAPTGGTESGAEAADEDGIGPIGGGTEPPVPVLGQVVAEELRDRGWTIEFSAGRVPDEGRGAQHLVLIRSTPRGWKGRASLSEAADSRVRELLDSSGPAYLILFGHPRLLAELGGAGACAWSSETIMERAAARWLDARVD